MKNKTCSECRFLGSAKETGLCEKRQICLYPEERPVCSKFEQKVVTNGDKIRQMSNEELAELLTNPPCFICSKGDAGGECTDTWVKKNCKEAIIVRLNAPADVCVKQNENDDTQTDLCKVDDTESEGKDEVR